MIKLNYKKYIKYFCSTRTYLLELESKERETQTKSDFRTYARIVQFH